MRPLLLLSVILLSAACPVLAQESAKPNVKVNEYLKAAEDKFSAGLNGCHNVRLALMAGNNPALYGQPIQKQLDKLRQYATQYATRCGLKVSG